MQSISDEFLVRRTKSFFRRARFSPHHRRLLSFQATLFIYDCGLLGDDKDLANALWRRFYGSQDHPDMVKMELLASYVRRTMSLLDHIDLETLICKDVIRWLPLEEQKRQRQ